MATLATNAPRNAFIQTMGRTANITASVAKLNATFLMDVPRKWQLLINIKFQVCRDL